MALRIWTSVCGHVKGKKIIYMINGNNFQLQDVRDVGVVQSVRTA